MFFAYIVFRKQMNKTYWQAWSRYNKHCNICLKLLMATHWGRNCSQRLWRKKLIWFKCIPISPVLHFLAEKHVRTLKIIRKIRSALFILNKCNFSVFEQRTGLLKKSLYSRCTYSPLLSLNIKHKAQCVLKNEIKKSYFFLISQVGTYAWTFSP